MNHMSSVFIIVVTLLGAAGSNALAQDLAGNTFIASDGARINYYTAGDQGSWVVLLHGYGDSARRMWFTTGIAPALAANHRVVAMDHLNHGQSDRPEAGGVGRVSDVVELMDRLGIEKAHIHGYSMGGAMVATMLYEYPERFITAGFGGSGLRETDSERNAFASSLDRRAPGAAPAAARGPGSQTAPAAAGGGPPGGGLAGFSRPLDLTTLDIPMIAINGEFDSPYGKTLRMWREVEVFHNVVLPGLNHFTAIAVGGPMPRRYIDSMVGFIAAYDEE